MSKTLLDLTPERVWKHFNDLCAIPHPSKHEEKIVEHIINFTKGIGLEYNTDAVMNIAVKKPASAGMESKKTIVFQSHVDMVPQKNSDNPHNFEKDPIQPWVDGDYVKAKGTTLGADNGIGVAMMMAMMEDKTLEHGPLEFLFTVDEETGMTGAFGLKPGFLTGDILVNLDTEDEGELYIGCAGGVDTLIEKNYSQVDAPQGFLPVEISLKGLKGGHSGCDIHLNRGNANKLMNELFARLEGKIEWRLNRVEGGNLRNAIPRESFAQLYVQDKAALEKEMKALEADLKARFGNDEPDLAFGMKDANFTGKVVEPSELKSFIATISKVHNGVLSMCKDMPEVVETSSNLAIVKAEAGKIAIHTSQRSSVEAEKNRMKDMVAVSFKEMGANVEHQGSYPGWAPNVKSPILDLMKARYKNMFGKEALVKVVHAGLECGLINSVYPKMDCISIGPNINFPHSPDERVQISTVKMVWDFVLDVMKHV